MNYGLVLNDGASTIRSSYVPISSVIVRDDSLYHRQTSTQGPSGAEMPGRRVRGGVAMGSSNNNSQQHLNHSLLSESTTAAVAPSFTSTSPTPNSRIQRSLLDDYDVTPMHHAVDSLNNVQQGRRVGGAAPTASRRRAGGVPSYMTPTASYQRKHLPEVDDDVGGITMDPNAPPAPSSSGVEYIGHSTHTTTTTTTSSQRRAASIAARTRQQQQQQQHAATPRLQQANKRTSTTRHTSTTQQQPGQQQVQFGMPPASYRMHSNDDPIPASAHDAASEEMLVSADSSITNISEGASDVAFGGGGAATIAAYTDEEGNYHEGGAVSWAHLQCRRLYHAYIQGVDILEEEEVHERMDVEDAHLDSLAELMLVRRMTAASQVAGDEGNVITSNNNRIDEDVAAPPSITEVGSSSSPGSSGSPAGQSSSPIQIANSNVVGDANGMENIDTATTTTAIIVAENVAADPSLSVSTSHGGDRDTTNHASSMPAQPAHEPAGTIAPPVVVGASRLAEEAANDDDTINHGNMERHHPPTPEAVESEKEAGQGEITLKEEEHDTHALTSAASLLLTTTDAMPTTQVLESLPPALQQYLHALHFQTVMLSGEMQRVTASHAALAQSLQSAQAELQLLQRQPATSTATVAFGARVKDTTSSSHQPQPADDDATTNVESHPSSVTSSTGGGGQSPTAAMDDSVPVHPVLLTTTADLTSDEGCGTTTTTQPSATTTRGVQDPEDALDVEGAGNIVRSIYHLIVYPLQCCTRKPSY